MSFDIQRGLRKRSRSKKRQHSRKSTYEKQREEETVRNATNRGYLRRMTIEFLNENVGLDDCDFPTVGYLNVTKLQLSSVGALKMCVNLRICILPGNYITCFDPLIHCVNLNMLDLSSNQIKTIPPDIFWATLRNLRIVYLHDNSISTLDTIHSLSSSSSILVLTMYDTPLSLKKNYRHHLVNGIWSLKVLDCYVVSDEEIIEDLSMSRQFSAMSDNLRIHLDHGLTKESSLQQAVNHMTGIIATINKTQAKFCPVLVIQRMIRGYLARKRYKQIMATREWAATTIQQFYRFKKGIPQPKSYFLPPTSPLSTTTTTGVFEDGTSYPDMSSQHYVGGTMSQINKVQTDGESSSLSVGSHRKRLGLGFDSGELVNMLLVDSHSSQGGLMVKKRLTIDLGKLESATWETLTSSGSSHDKMKQSRTNLEGKKNAKRSEKSLRENESHKSSLYQLGRKFEKEHRLKPEKIGKYQTVRVFLGTVVEQPVDSDDDDGLLNMYGNVPPHQKNDPVVDMILTKQEMGRVTRRDRENEQRLVQIAAKKKRKLVKSEEKMTNDQKLFMRTHGTMGLACLRAVHQAYRDRERAQEQANKAAHVAEMRERRGEVTNKLQLMRMDYQENVITDRIQDGVRIADALHENKKKQADHFKKVAARRLDAVTRERVRKEEMQFIKDFASQQISVSQALRAHDKAEMKKHKLGKLTEVVRKERETTIKQQALVKRYMDHRQLLQQTDVIRAKTELDIWMVEEAKRQLLEAEERVKERKNSLDKAKEFKTLPPFNVATTRDKPLCIMFPGQQSLISESRDTTESCFNESSLSETSLRDSSHLTL